MNKLRAHLRQSIESKGFNLEDIFKKFDANGDGKFDQTEFEACFTVLEIQFKVADLRKLIDLSDKNNDGVIDFPEFHEMLYPEKYKSN